MVGGVGPMFWLLACVSAPTPPPAEPPAWPVDPAFTGEVDIPGARVAYYPVTGRDDIEVWSSLVATAPKRGGLAHAGETRWEVTWSWPDGGACAPVTVTADIVVSFPRWDAPAD